MAILFWFGRVNLQFIIFCQQRKRDVTNFLFAILFWAYYWEVVTEYIGFKRLDQAVGMEQMTTFIRAIDFILK